MESMYEQPVSRRAVLVKDEEDDKKYSLSIVTEGLASYETLIQPAKEKKAIFYTLRGSLEKNHAFLKEQVDRYLDFPWGRVSFWVNKVEELLSRDQLVVTCNFITGLMAIGSNDSGSVIVDFNGKTAKISRSHNRKSPIDVFDCINLHYTQNNSIRRTYEYAER